MGCGDPRHLMYSVFCAQRAGGMAARQSLSLVMCDVMPSILARNIVLYKLLLDGAEAAVECERRLSLDSGMIFTACQQATPGTMSAMRNCEVNSDLVKDESVSRSAGGPSSDSEEDSEASELELFELSELLELLELDSKEPEEPEEPEEPGWGVGSGVTTGCTLAGLRVGASVGTVGTVGTGSTFAGLR
ncbi:hypothetical protein B484DRAFT_407437, partial [Ochromonadaceae sp. CCMP2298]